METALYFPYVRVPETPWFTQVLLYWDSAAAIVPPSLQHTNAVPPYMSELVREGLLEYVDPDRVLSRQWDTFDQAFLDMLESQTGPSDTAPWTFTRIHSGKLSYALFCELRRRGLAERTDGPGWDLWWRVEATTATSYLAYLAAAISGARAGTLPVTDQERAIASLGGDEGDARRRLASLRYTVVNHALPAPTATVPARELRAFKETHSEQLTRCRRYLDGRIAELAAVADPFLRAKQADWAMQEIEDDVATLQERMRKRRWPHVALMGIGGVMAAALGVAVAGVTGGSALAIGLGVGAGVAQLGQAGKVAADLIRQPRYDPRHPLAYAVLAAQL